jgi:hypothetical protein
MAGSITEDWDLWYPEAGASGIPFARGRIGTSAGVVLVHAAPPKLTVTVRDSNGHTLAEGVDLPATDKTPITRLRRVGKTIERDDIWPGEAEHGLLVLLPGGEVGTLKHWWHADDHSEWRWTLELYNHR